MSKLAQLWGMTFCCLVASGALADAAILSGAFNGDEPVEFNIHDSCNSDPLPYQVQGPISVSESGSYEFRDAAWLWSVDTEVSVHDGPLNVNDPEGNVIATTDDAGSIELASGKDYYVVVQPFCSPDNGTWGITIRGPGEISGDPVIAAPAWSLGEFDGSEPLINLSGDAFCPRTYYDVTGPVQVERNGTYYLHAPEHFVLNPNLVAVYANEFDPDRPNRNLVNKEVTGMQLDLEQGTDYFFVVQPDCALRLSDWLLVLFPPLPFGLNPGLNGSWVDPTTDGQGMFMDVFANAGVLFLAWFTYDSMMPDAAETREVGKAGNTWLVAQGGFADGDASVDLDLYFRGGGRFNDPETVPDPIEKVGSGTLDMESCLQGTLTYALDSGLAGSARLNRIALDNVDLCESFFAEPGVIGE